MLGAVASAVSLYFKRFRQMYRHGILDAICLPEVVYTQGEKLASESPVTRPYELKHFGLHVSFPTVVISAPSRALFPLLVCQGI